MPSLSRCPLGPRPGAPATARGAFPPSRRRLVAHAAVWLAALAALTLPATEGATAQEPRAGERPPDLILTDGKVFTADPARPFAAALAIRGERIVGVGTTAEIAALAGPGTRRIDLRGRTVIPGINDAHTHFFWRDPEAHTLSFSKLDPAWAEVREAVVAAARKLPSGTPIRGTAGVRLVDEPGATRFALDSLAPGHPVYIGAYYGHGELLSTAALRAEGIGETDPDPPHGFYGRLEDSDVLDGWLYEYAQWRLLPRRVAPEHREGAIAAFRAFADRALRFGITSIQDMPGLPSATFAGLVVEAGLPLRVRVIRLPAAGEGIGMSSEPGMAPGPGMAPDRSEEPGPSAGGSGIRVDGVKWILDGTPLERGAAMREPYSDRAAWTGRLNFESRELEHRIRGALAADEQILVHVAGDHSAEVVLDVMERLAVTEGVEWPARRLRLEHGDGVSGELAARAARLGAVVVQNPTHFANPPVIRARVGDRPYQRLRSLDEAGVPIAIGSDGEPNPYLNILLATLHPNDPSEAIGRERAVEAYTRGAAYAEFREEEKGTLAPGMLADLAVLSQDIFSVPAEALPGTESVLTLVGGEVAYDGGVLAGEP